MTVAPCSGLLKFRPGPDHDAEPRTPAPRRHARRVSTRPALQTAASHFLVRCSGPRRDAGAVRRHVRFGRELSANRSVRSAIDRIQLTARRKCDFVPIFPSGPLGYGAQIWGRFLMTRRQRLLFDVPRRPRLVRMHVFDAFGDNGEDVCRFRCNRCGHETDWIRVRTTTEARRGLPCPDCNGRNT